MLNPVQNPVQPSSEMSPIRCIGVIGSRTLPLSMASKVGAVTEDVLCRGFHVATGGAIGTDQLVLERLMKLNQSQHGTIHAAWQNYAGFPVTVRSIVREFRLLGGSILWGGASGNESHSLLRLALLGRNQRLVQACYGLVAFINEGSRGSIFTIQKAAARRMPLVVFPHECPLPEINFVKWVPLKCGGPFEGAFKGVYLK